MSIYYILAKVDGADTIYTLDATEAIEHSLPVQSSSYAIEDGSDISDNIALKPRRVSFSGVISDVKTVDSTAYLDTHDYIQGLEDLRWNKELFTLYFTSDQPPLLNVFFESLKISQDGVNGTLVTPEGDRYGVSSFKVSFTVKEFRFSSQAILSVIRADELNINKKSDSTSTTSLDDETTDSKTKSEKTFEQAKKLWESS